MTYDLVERAATLLPVSTRRQLLEQEFPAPGMLEDSSTTVGYPEIFLTEHSFQAEKPTRHSKEGNCVFHYQTMNKTHMGGEISSSHECERSVGIRELKPSHTNPPHHQQTRQV